MCIFFIGDIKDTTNFTIGLQITMLLITKKWFKHSLVKLIKFINETQCHIIFWTFYSAFSTIFIFDSQSMRPIETLIQKNVAYVLNHQL